MLGVNFLILYVAVFWFHFAYAAVVLKTKRFSLAMGPISSPPAILTGLLMVNGLSLTAWVWPTANWVWFNIIYHAILAVDEIVRTRKVRGRWPFLLNHLLFCVILWGLLKTIPQV